jgi:hypothetical protein
LAAAVVTVTVVDAELLPPGPVQLRVYWVEAVSTPVDALPAVDLLPDQPPEAAQLVALVALQVRVLALPEVIDNGDAVSDTVGAGVAAVTVTVVEAELLPPGPVQLRLYWVEAVSAPVDALPAVDLLPDHPPEAVQLVALVALQVRVLALPEVIDNGDAVSDTVGAGVAGAAGPEKITSSTYMVRHEVVAESLMLSV